MFPSGLRIRVYDPIDHEIDVLGYPAAWGLAKRIDDLTQKLA